MTRNIYRALIRQAEETLSHREATESLEFWSTFYDALVQAQGVTPAIIAKIAMMGVLFSSACIAGDAIIRDAYRAKLSRARVYLAETAAIVENFA